MSEWFRPLDPTGGIVGLRSRYVPRGPEPVTTAAKPAPPVVATAPLCAPVVEAPAVEPGPCVVAEPAPAMERHQAHAHAAQPIAQPIAQIPTPPPPPPRTSARLRTRLLPETVRGRIVIAAALCAAGAPGIEVTTADVVVRAWRAFPEVFGLRGYAAQHPDSNRVLAKLSGQDGLIEAGFLSRGAESGAVKLTERGATWWRQIGARWLAAQKAGT